MNGKKWYKAQHKWGNVHYALFIMAEDIGDATEIIDSIPGKHFSSLMKSELLDLVKDIRESLDRLERAIK